MMIEIYGLKNCDRCRAALKWLKSQELEARFHDVRQDGFPEKEARKWITVLGTDSAINRRSTTWRQLPPARRASNMTTEEALALLKEFPALLKRPVIEIEGAVLIGFDDDVKTEIKRIAT